MISDFNRRQLREMISLFFAKLMCSLLHRSGHSLFAFFSCTQSDSFTNNRWDAWLFCWISLNLLHIINSLAKNSVIRWGWGKIHFFRRLLSSKTLRCIYLVESFHFFDLDAWLSTTIQTEVPSMMKNGPFSLMLSLESFNTYFCWKITLYYLVRGRTYSLWAFISFMCSIMLMQYYLSLINRIAIFYIFVCVQGIFKRR